MSDTFTNDRTGEKWEFMCMSGSHSFVTIRKVEPKPFPELKPGMKVLSQANKFAVIRSERSNKMCGQVGVWVEGGSSSQWEGTARTIKQVYDTDGKLIWERES